MSYIAALALALASATVHPSGSVADLRPLVQAAVAMVRGGCVASTLSEASDVSRTVETWHRGWDAGKGKAPLSAEVKAELVQAYRSSVATRSADFSKTDVQGIRGAIRLVDGPESTCKRLTTLSAPRVHGSWAFVERGVTCGLLCGAGFMEAWRRRNGRWQLVATNPSWIS